MHRSSGAMNFQAPLPRARQTGYSNRPVPFPCDAPLNMTRADAETTVPLHDHVGRSLDEYFNALNGSEPPSGLYRLVLEQVEKPLLTSVLEYSQGNQSRAAQVLGINRGTLRKKLKQYNLEY